MIDSGAGEWLVTDKRAKRPLNFCVQRVSHRDDAAESEVNKQRFQNN